MQQPPPPVLQQSRFPSSDPTSEEADNQQVYHPSLDTHENVFEPTVGNSPTHNSPTRARIRRSESVSSSPSIALSILPEIALEILREDSSFSNLGRGRRFGTRDLQLLNFGNFDGRDIGLLWLCCGLRRGLRGRCGLARRGSGGGCIGCIGASGGGRG